VSLLLAALAAALLAAEAPRTGPGVVVERVPSGSAVEGSGPRPGDVLTSWRRLAASSRAVEAEGLLDTPFDLTRVDIEERPRGTITLLGTRDGAPFSWTMTNEAWWLTVRPRGPAWLLERDARAAGRVAKGRRHKAVREWRKAAARLRKERAGALAAWPLLRAAEALDAADTPAEGDVLHAEAVGWIAGAGHPSAAAEALRVRGEAAAGREGADGQALLRRAEELDRRQGEGLSLARSLSALARAACRRGDWQEEERLQQAAHQVRERLAPGSLDLAEGLDAVAHVATHRQDSQAHEARHLEALAVFEQAGLPPRRLAQALRHVGVLALVRGDPETAEGHYRRALSLLQAAAPGSLEVAAALTDLAEVAMQRVELAAGERLYREALALYEAADPESLEVANIHFGLGTVARMRDDWVTAEAAYQRVLSIQEKLAPESHALAQTLCELAIVALDQGQLDRAHELVERAFPIVEKLGLDTLTAANLLEQRGRIAWQKDDLDNAQRFLEQGMILYGRLAPGALSEAETVFALGWTHRQRGQLEQAAEHLCRLVDVVEGSKSRLGGSEDARADYAAKLGSYYSECLEVLVDLGRHTQAFDMLERARAQRFLALLAQRDVTLPGEGPPDLELEARRLRREYDQAQGRLWDLAPGAPAGEALRDRLRELRAALDAVRDQVRARSRRPQALRRPPALGYGAVREALDPGTLLVSYNVGPQRTLLFAESRAGLSVHTIPADEGVLRDRVESFRRLIERGRVSGDLPPALLEQGHALYRDLLGPVASQLGAAERVLVCPDGPLHALPFAALLAEVTPAPRFLAEWKPVHVAVSATAYVELKGRRTAAPTDRATVVAFGDPSGPGGAAGPGVGAAFRDPDLRSAAVRGLRFSPLPAARVEVAGLRRLFPQTVAWVGEEATEERAKALPPGVRYLHFACHGFLDEAMPLNSGLVLSLRDSPVEGEENGLLQAWEIFESVRTDAELVTLSACGTGLGREVVGEGLVGLTRAFHYAGARSVLASLWSVFDRSTAALMSHFYGALRAGAPKDQALASAQRLLIKDPRTRHPFHWAAFQLAGDWR
jgi:CHAT domain-containing protein